MKSNQKHLALILALSPISSLASSDTILPPRIWEGWSISTEINLITDHSDGTYNDINGVAHAYNESNNLVSLGISKGGWSLGVSTFENSYFERSNMISIERELWNFGGVGLVGGVGVVTGYDVNILRDDTFFFGDTLVTPLLGVEYHSSHLSLGEFGVVPKIRMMGLDTYMLNVELTYNFEQ